MLKQGEKAPEFGLPDQNGKMHKLADYKGKKVVLYFYPRDMTTGCTIEACKFRDDFNEYRKRGINVIGVSNDDEKSHQKFIEKEKLPFTLLSDKDKTVVNKYGVYGEKNFLGKKYMGIKRTTFLIDEKGRIIKVYEKVEPGKHSMEILGDISRL